MGLEDIFMVATLWGIGITTLGLSASGLRSEPGPLKDQVGYIVLGMIGVTLLALGFLGGTAAALRGVGCG